MFDSDIPKPILLKVLADCWREHSNVDCWQCRERYNRVSVLSEAHYAIDHDWDACVECQDAYANDKQRRLESYQTPSSPECVRVLDQPLDGQAPIVRVGDENPYGGAGWVVTMTYSFGMTCRHCSNDISRQCAIHFISEDGSNVSCWAD